MERVYQYLWRHGLIGDRRKAGRGRVIHTVDGRRVEVVCNGRLNTDAGPDFLGARIRIDGEEWAGNVEVHVKASDWHSHNHDRDAAYDNVILHVVAVSDTRIHDRNGREIPQTVISFPESFISLYSRLAENISNVPCERELASLSPIVKTGWMESLAVERLQQKARRILDTVRMTGGDWERACFITLARTLGFSLNADPMEMLARSLPLYVLAKHSDDIMQTEALLFGQAGMLDSSRHIFDEYYQTLCREYYFLARKYGLRPMWPDMWKYARTRPQNFPARRIALLAQTLMGGFSLFSSILDPSCNNETACALFDWKLDGYWLEHLDFDKPGIRLSPGLSENAVQLLAINLAAPTLYAYGAWRGDPELAERGLDIWKDASPENNVIVRRWKAAGLSPFNASDTQGLLQLSKEYCDRNRCLDCRFGHILLRESFFGS